jgi:hypothetical protein
MPDDIDQFGDDPDLDDIPEEDPARELTDSAPPNDGEPVDYEAMSVAEINEIARKVVEEGYQGDQPMARVGDIDLWDWRNADGLSQSDPDAAPDEPQFDFAVDVDEKTWSELLRAVRERDHSAARRLGRRVPKLLPFIPVSR